MNFFDNHHRLFLTAFLLFCVLTLFVAIFPALENQRENQPLPAAVPLEGSALRGKNIYIANGCVGCHTQQVRSVEMDRMWGGRAGVAADYADNRRISLLINTATLMGTERTGPDLTNIGSRQSSIDWNLIHLYNPRAVVSASIMPSYKWLFSIKNKPDPKDVIVKIPGKFMSDSTKYVVASQQAIDLVDYLLSLKQVSLPQSKVPEFLYGKPGQQAGGTVKKELEGKLLYTTHCQACHQSSGEGLAGAFPSLKGSSIVKGDRLSLYVDIIMNGYDASEQYGVMPSVGKTAKFTTKEVTAIINYERSSWGNQGEKVSEQQVKKIMDGLNTLSR